MRRRGSFWRARGSYPGISSPLTCGAKSGASPPIEWAAARVPLASRSPIPSRAAIRRSKSSIAAAFPNPRRTLRPGQYGRVRAETRTVDGAILVPQRAVTEMQGGYQVRVVGPDNRIATRPVTMGDRFGSRWIVAKGVEPNEHVVVEGAQVRDGTIVNPKPWTQAASETQPAAH